MLGHEENRLRFKKGAGRIDDSGAGATGLLSELSSVCTTHWENLKKPPLWPSQNGIAFADALAI